MLRLPADEIEEVGEESLPLVVGDPCMVTEDEGVLITTNYHDGSAGGKYHPRSGPATSTGTSFGSGRGSASSRSGRGSASCTILATDRAQHEHRHGYRHDQERTTGVAADSGATAA